jgi:hypothetical protein
MRVSTAAVVALIAAGLFAMAAVQSPERFFLTNLGALDASRPISYFIEDGAGVEGYQPHDRDLARHALGAWSRESGGRLRFVEAAPGEEALIRVIWNSARRGLFGQTARVHVDGRPGALVYVMPDVSGLGPELARSAGEDALLRDTIVYLTAVHELGHAVGLPHTRAFEDIMYSFEYGGDFVEYFMRYRRRLETRQDFPAHPGLSSNDQAMLRRLYGSEE